MILYDFYLEYANIIEFYWLLLWPYVIGVEFAFFAY